MKQSVLAVALLVLALVVPFASAQQNEPGLFDTCPAAAAWWDETAPTLVEFLDVAEIALFTSRVSVAPLLVELRSVQRDYQRMEAPDCASLLSFYMNGMMEAVYSGFAEALGHAPTGFWRGFTDANFALYAASTLIDLEQLRQVDSRLVTPEQLWGGNSRNDIEAFLLGGDVPHESIVSMATMAAYTATPTYTPGPTRTPRPTLTPSVTPTVTPSPTRSPSRTPAPRPTVASSSAYLCQVINLNPEDRFIRAQPNVNSAQVGMLPPATIASVLEQQRPNGQLWYRISFSFEGREMIGWIAASNVQPVDNGCSAFFAEEGERQSDSVIPPTVENARISIIAVRDPRNITNELVEIRNSDTAVVDLTGWKLRDADGNEYLFPPEQRLFGGGSITVFSRVGEDTAIALFWDRQQPAFTRGEVIVLFDNQGRAQSVFTVP